MAEVRGGAPTLCPPLSHGGFPGAAPLSQVAFQDPKLALKPYSPGFKSKFCHLVSRAPVSSSGL